MLSFKKWKKLNENLCIPLGVGQPNKIADLHSKWDESGFGGKTYHPHGKKCGTCSKGMFGDEGPEGEGEGPGGPPPKGKKKPPMPAPDEDNDLGGAPDDDLGGKGPVDDVPPPDDEEGLEGPEGEGPEGEGPEGEEGLEGPGPGDEGPAGEEGGDLPAPPVKGPAGKRSIINRTKDVADGAKMMHKGAQKMVKGMKEGCKGKKTMDSCQDKKMTKMTKEEAEFFKSLQAQTGAVKFAKDEDGDWVAVHEDAVIPPSDPNAEITQDDEAQPGEVGYAPQGRLGSNFSEWAEKYQRKTKVNESTKAPPTQSWFQ